MARFAVRTLMVLFFCFSLLHFLPGNPFEESEQLSPKVFASLSHHFGGDLPKGAFFEKFNIFLKNFLSFDFGISVRSPQKTVIDVVVQALAPTWTLFLGSMALILVISQILFLIAVGLELEIEFRNFGRMAVTVPVFILVPILIFIFGFQFHFSIVQTEHWTSWIMPCAALAFRPIFLFLNWQLLGVEKESHRPWFKFFLGLGFSRRQLKLFWSYRQTWTSNLAFLPGLLVSLFMGSVFVESLFQIQGLGFLLLQSLLLRDSVTLMVLFYLTSLGYFLFQNLSDYILKKNPRDEY